MKGKFHMIKKSLLILLTAASIALSGCGQNSAAGTAPAESSTKAESTAAGEISEGSESTAANETTVVNETTAANESTAASETTVANETTAASGTGTPAEDSVISGAGAAVSYLGPAGTYTEEAAQFFFPEAENMMPKGTVDEAIAEVMNGTADYAVIPQEQIDKISGIEEVRLVGKFRSVEKTT